MKTTHEIADRMADRAAEKAYAHKAATVDDFKAAVVEQIPLLELIEVARAAKTISFYEDAKLKEALSKLKYKLPDL